MFSLLTYFFSLRSNATQKPHIYADANRRALAKETKEKQTIDSALRGTSKSVIG